jgi:hypothetical protein
MAVVATLTILTAPRMGMSGAKHSVGFDNMEDAQAQYVRLQGLLLQSDRVVSNGAPAVIEVIGNTAKVSFLASELSSVSILEWAKIEAEEKSNRKKYPVFFAAEKARRKINN